MTSEDLASAINYLTVEQQEFVQQSIDYLESKEAAPASPFLAAVDELISQHPELLRRLAQ